MKQLCIDLKARLPEIVEEVKLVAGEAPLDIPADHDVNALPHVVLGLIEASICTPVNERAHLEKVSAAVEHGETRRNQEYPESILFGEYAVVREALRRIVRRTGAKARRQTEALIRIDMAATVAELASLRGYHRRELEASGRWAGTIERLARESPLLTLPTAD